MKKSKLSECQINMALNAFIDITKEELLKNNKIVIRNFGTFEILNKKEKMWKNPYTLEKTIIPAHKWVKWKASSNLLK